MEQNFHLIFNIVLTIAAATLLSSWSHTIGISFWCLRHTEDVHMCDKLNSLLNLFKVN